MASAVQESLAWEARQRPRVAVAGILAAITTVFGVVAALVVFRNYPAVLVVDAIRDAAGLPLPGGKGLRYAQNVFLDDHAGILVAIAIINAIAALSTAVVLAFLFRATRVRSESMSQPVLVAVVAGAVIVAVCSVIVQVAAAIDVHNFVTGSDFSTKAAHDALNGSLLVLATSMRGLLGIPLLGLGFIVIALNAMRVGLLTRFMGVLGIVIGAMLCLALLGAPVGQSVQVIEAFWLLAVAVLLVGRWPGGAPPAWERGVAVPWPSQQEVREQRERAAAAARDDRDIEIPDAPTGTPAPKRANPSASKKRRKRR